MEQTRLTGKVFDFVFYMIMVVAILAVTILWLSRWEALVTAGVIFAISSGTIVHISISSFQKNMIKEAPYYKVNYKIFSPFALVMSFAAMCYLLNIMEPKLFVGSKNASIMDFSIFAFDNILRVIFWDVPEIYGISATKITHNVDNLIISSLVLVFRTLIGLSLIKMFMVFLRNR